MNEPLFCALAGIAFGFAVSAWSSLKRVDARIDWIDARSREAEESAERAELVVGELERERGERDEHLRSGLEDAGRDLVRLRTELHEHIGTRAPAVHTVDRPPPGEG